MKNRRWPQKNIMEDNLNFKAVLFRLFNNKNLQNKWVWHHRDWPSLLALLEISILKKPQRKVTSWLTISKGNAVLILAKTWI